MAEESRFKKWIQNSIFNRLEDKKMPVMQHLFEFQTWLTKVIIFFEKSLQILAFSLLGCAFPLVTICAEEQSSRLSSELGNPCDGLSRAECNDLYKNLNIALHQLNTKGPTTEFRDASLNLKIFASSYQSRALPGTPDSATKVSRKRLERLGSASVDHFVDTTRRLPPEFKQPAFQCLGDHNKCRETNIGRLGCVIGLAVCLTERVIPLTGGGQ